MRFARITLVAMLALLLAVLPAQAETAVSGVSVSPAVGNTNYVSLSFDFSDGTAEYSAFITAIRAQADDNAWAEPLANAVADAFLRESVLKIVNRGEAGDGVYVAEGIDLMDCEKQNRRANGDWGTDEYYDNTDAVLCWAASTTNMLELSGWAKAAMALYPEKQLALNNEDEIFAYFVQSFSDAGNEAIYGSRWFLTGVNYDQCLDEETGKVAFWSPVAGNAQQKDAGTGGFAPQYCGETLVEGLYSTHEDSFTEYTTLQHMNEAADRLTRGYGVGLGLESAMFGHDVTLTGVVRRRTADGLGDVCAILIADSDNDVPEYDYADAAAAEAAGNRADRVNSFTLYPVKWLEEGDGAYASVYMKGFWAAEGNGYEMRVSQLYTIPPYGGEYLTETEGTADALNDPDIISVTMRLGADEYDSEVEVEAGTEIMISPWVMNNSYAAIPAEGDPVLTVRLHICREGEEVDVLTLTSTLTADELLPRAQIRSLSTKYTFTTPGEYTITTEIVSLENAGGAIREAYVQNNTAAPRALTVVAAR